MEDCKGPCLEHCYSKNSIAYMILGFLIGILLTVIYYKFIKNKIKRRLKRESNI